ncbi:MAG: patatin-like phospholipase family protein [Nanoarchaeota archaeon]|nr:patatin-like phospholipase family protein [Nanoarchaeota archaeon]
MSVLKFIRKTFEPQPKVGLALGSGGAKGFVHIGVIKILIENNIPLNFISGSSIGSVIGAYFALNKEVNLLEKKILSLSKKDIFKFISLINLKKGLINDDKIKDFILELVNNKSFSDTRIPLKILATDLEKGEEVILDKGKLIDSIMASISLPAIFPVKKLNNRILVDGGLLNPTPVDVVKKMGADIIIAVDLSEKGKVEIKNPNPIRVLVRCFDILRDHTVKSRIKNIENLVIIHPKFSKRGVDTFNFFEAKKLIKLGEDTTKQSLPEIKELLENS